MISTHPFASPLGEKLFLLNARRRWSAQHSNDKNAATSTHDHGMNTILTTIILALTLTSSILVSDATPDTQATNAPGNPVIVKGKDFEIRQSDLDQVLSTLKARFPKEELPSDAPVHAIAQLVEVQLVLNKATDAEKAEGRKQADEKLAAIAKEFSASEMEQRLKATHMTVDDLRLKFSQEMTAQLSLARQLGIQVTEADAKKYFDDHPGAYDRPVMARGREILLLTTSDFTTSAAPPLPPAAIQAKRTLMDDLLKRARSGEDFAALARQYNEDPMSKNSSGEISFQKDEVEFGDLAFSMRTNQVSDVLTNQEGFLIFQMLEILPAQKTEFAAVAGQIKSGLIGEAKQRLAPDYIRQLRKEAIIEILDPGLKAAVAANDAEMAANARQAEEAQAAASAEANSPAQKAAEAKVFGSSTNQNPAKP
jgi:parvulin-like peptidyl-prolyl isomerase